MGIRVGYALRARKPGGYITFLHQLNYDDLWVKLLRLRVGYPLESSHDFALFKFFHHTQYLEALLPCEMPHTTDWKTVAHGLNVAHHLFL